MPDVQAKTNTATRPGAGRWLFRLGLPLAALAAVFALIGGHRKTQSVSDVIEQIHAVALKKPDGGFVGEWWVSAKGVDPVGRLLNFRVEAGPVYFAAQTARVAVDPERDSVTFEMAGVVLIRVDEPAEGEDPDRPLVEMDRYELGPIFYTLDIVP